MANINIYGKLWNATTEGWIADGQQLSVSTDELFGTNGLVAKNSTVDFSSNFKTWYNANYSSKSAYGTYIPQSSINAYVLNHFDEVQSSIDGIGTKMNSLQASIDAHDPQSIADTDITTAAAVLDATA